MLGLAVAFAIGAIAHLDKKSDSDRSLLRDRYAVDEVPAGGLACAHRAAV